VASGPFWEFIICSWIPYC